MTRTPVRDHYDADVGFFPASGVPMGIFAVVKRTYDLRTGTLAPAEPLHGNVWAAEGPDRLQPGSDYWVNKPGTDVAVVGSAYLLPAAPRGTVTVGLGERVVRIEVFGPRVARWRRGAPPRFEAPEPVSEVPMEWGRAYGGGDPRVPFAPPKSFAEWLHLHCDRPGLYPRNQVGRGYIVVDDPVDDVPLPQLEDPDDLLTPERFVVRDPALWYRQPIPAGLGLRPPSTYPRRLFIGADAWFPAPEDERLPEVRRGELPAGYRSRHGLRATPGFESLDLRFLCEAAPSLVLTDARPGLPIQVRGMHPEGWVAAMRLPEPPRVEIFLEGRVQTPPVRPSLVVVRPGDERVTVTWATHTTQSHRTFVPGLHAHIPLAVRVDGDAPVPYVTPPTQAALREAARTGG